ncbi:craniofacial development protein 2-like protein [Tanacetum coccineum]
MTIGGDLNGHIGASAEGYTGIHEGFSFGDRNEEGRTILEFATAHDLIKANSFFKKSDAHLITFQSGGHKSQIDYLLVRRGDLRASATTKEGADREEEDSVEELEGAVVTFE